MSTPDTIRPMEIKTRAGVIGAFAVLGLLLIQSIEHWTVVDAVITGLRSRGAVGVFVVSLLLSPVVPLAIAIATILLVWEGRKERKQKSLTPELPSIQPVSSASSVKDSGNSTSTSTGNILNLTLGPLVPAAQPTHLHAPIPGPKNLPNIQLVRAKSVWVEPDGNQFFEKSGKTEFQAFVACFRNEPIFGRTDIVDANFVSASGLYFDSQKREINEGVAGLCWLNNGRGHVNLEVGKATQNAILLIFDSRKNHFFIPFLEQRPSGWGPVATLDVCEVKQDIASMALRLIGSKGTLLPDLHFDLKRVGDNWDIALSACDAPGPNEATRLLPRVYVADWLDESNLFVPASPIVLENRGREVAHAVQILPITVFYKEVKFDPIDTIAVGEKKKVFPRISGADTDHNSLFYLLKQELDARNEAQGKQDIAITFPLTIVYKDPSGVHNCETSADLMYNPINRETGAAAKKNKWEDWPHESLGWYQITHHLFK